MKLKSYDFYSHGTILVSDGNGCFTTVDKGKLEECLVVDPDGCAHIEFEHDGVLYTNYYFKDDKGNILRLEKETEVNAICCIDNPKANVSKGFCIERMADEICSEEELWPIVSKDGVLGRERIVVPPGIYKRNRNNSFFVGERDIYSDDFHAAWYHECTVDGVKETPRADIVRISKMDIDALKSMFSSIEAFAKNHNIKFAVDEYTGSIRAFKEPEGYKVECEEGDYADQIPWELMPVIGKCTFTINSDSDYQLTLYKKED